MKRIGDVLVLNTRKLDKSESSCSNKRKRLDESEYDGSSKRTKLDLANIVFVEADPGESYTPFIDPGYNLMFYLSQYAIHVFNLDQLSRCGFKTNSVELYENVDVVNAFKSLSPLHDTQTYLITFKAYLPSKNTAQTFETKIIFRSRRTTKVVVLFVRIKAHDDPSQSQQKPVLDYFSDSEDIDQDEVSQLNPAFVKKVPRKKTPKISPEDDPTYRPCPNIKYMRRPSMGVKEGSPLSKEIQCFKVDVSKTGGFEVGHYPLMDQAGIPGTWICKYYDIENKPLPALYLTRLLYLSQLAVCVYNMKQDSHFENVKVLRTMTYGSGVRAYNITFEASLSDKNAVVFQTNMSTSIALPVNKIKIKFVRIKPS